MWKVEPLGSGPWYEYSGYKDAGSNGTCGVVGVGIGIFMSRSKCSIGLRDDEGGDAGDCADPMLSRKGCDHDPSPETGSFAIEERLSADDVCETFDRAEAGDGGQGSGRA